MRIRLCVERNTLPAANVLWPVTEDENGAKTTVARFLTQVDRVLPLESAEWCLEDYVVQIDGFELLHYQNLSDVLKDDDRVTYVLCQCPSVPRANTSPEYVHLTAPKSALVTSPAVRRSPMTADTSTTAYPSASRSLSIPYDRKLPFHPVSADAPILTILMKASICSKDDTMNCSWR
jgi:hypothetical protein